MSYKNSEYLNCTKLLDEKEIVDFLAELIKTKSYPPEFNEKDVAVVVAKKLKEYDIESTIDELPDLDGIGRVNFNSHIGNQERPNLVYSGHFDTVAAVAEDWDYDPFSAEIVDGRMYGRGTADMKAGVASMVMAMCLLKKAGIELNGKLSFAGTAGEEVGCQGSKEYYKKYGNKHIDAMVVSEASNQKLFLAEKGAFWLKFTSYGKAAHPSVAWEGINALSSMLKFVNAFNNYEFEVKDNELLGGPTLNVTTMHSGTITNALPTVCEATADIRTLPGISHDKILEYVEQIITELEEEDEDFKLEYEVINDFPPIETDKDNEFAKIAFETHEQVLGKPATPSGAFYFTDAVEIIKDDDIPLIIYGPGNPTMNHKANESIDLKEVIDATKYYIGLAINYLD